MLSRRTFKTCPSRRNGDDGQSCPLPDKWKGSKEYTPRKGVEMVGKLVSFNKDGSDSVRVSAVCENQKYNEYTSQQAALYYVRNDGFKCTYASIPYQDLFIRVKADADRPGFVEAFRKEMKKQLRVGNLYLADMRPMSEFRNEQLSDYRSELYTYLAIAGFFLINAFLAVLGTFGSVPNTVGRNLPSESLRELLLTALCGS